MEPLIIKRGNIVLRDRTFADLADHRRWLTTEIRWLDWDAPWEENNPQENEQYLARIEKRLEEPPPRIRPTLEICLLDGAHIGLVNAYYIGGDRERIAAGIGIRESSYWGRGLGTEAFILWLGYLFLACEKPILYCETWSGNIPMVKLAKKTCFRRCQRLPNHREVRGMRYHGLTYALSRQEFLAKYPELKDLNLATSKGV